MRRFRLERERPPPVKFQHTLAQVMGVLTIVCVILGGELTLENWLVPGPRHAILPGLTICVAICSLFGYLIYGRWRAIIFGGYAIVAALATFASLLGSMR